MTEDYRNEGPRRVGQVKDRANDTWDRLEKVFEERVQRALTRLGVPGREELQSLIGRVDELNARLRDLAGGSAPAEKKTPPKKPAAAKKPVTTPNKSAKKASTPATPVAATQASASDGNVSVTAKPKTAAVKKTAAKSETPTSETPPK